MFVEKLKSEGLAHLSYVVGDGNQAAVIDPRRDVDAYLDIAQRHGARITHVFETHRNEDYVVGSCELARRTGAQIFHGAALDFRYGSPVRDGMTFDLGDVRFRILETPGHTFESISIVLHDRAYGDAPVAVFTGDTLFIGDVGRIDLVPKGREPEAAAALYDSIFHKLLPLGDHVILFPAHGAGSVCGSGMAERELSTLGFERLNNPALQHARDAFVAHKLAERHERPPYFRAMERANLEGPRILTVLPDPPAITPDALASAIDAGALVVDTRSPEAYAGASIPGSIALPLDLIATYAGWLLPYERDLLLVADDHAAVREAVRRLVRIGYERIAGWLAGGMPKWETSGRDYQTIATVHSRELSRRIRDRERFLLLDVRKRPEFDEAHLPGAVHVFLGDLAPRIADLPRERPISVFCGSGRRSTVAASLLAREGVTEIEIALGSMKACQKLGCPIVKAA